MFVYILTCYQHTDNGKVDSGNRYFRTERAAKIAGNSDGANGKWYAETNSLFSALLAADRDVRHLSYRIHAERLED